MSDSTGRISTINNNDGLAPINPRKVRVPIHFEEPKAGQWIQPVKRNYLFKCCGCGMVHAMDFRVHEGRAQFRAYLVEALPRALGNKIRKALSILRNQAQDMIKEWDVRISSTDKFLGTILAETEQEARAKATVLYEMVTEKECDEELDVEWRRP